MALVVADRVQETTNTTGTGTLTLAGAVSGYQSFSVIGNASTTYYTIVSGTSWETGIGTYTLSGTTLSRDTVLASSASGAKITVAAGAAVFCSYPAGKSLYLDSSSNAIGLGTPAAFTATNVTGLPISTGVSGLGTGVATALAVNTGSTGAFVVNGGALGTPSGGTVTNLTGTASININGTVGATTATTGAFTTVSASGVITSTLTTGTAPFTIASTTQVANLNAATAGTATSATTATNLAGGALGSIPYQNAAGTTLFVTGNITTTPQFVTSTGASSAATAPTLTGSTGSGNVVLATSPTLVTPALGTPASGVVTNLTGTASININGTVGATTPSTGAFTTLSTTTAIPLTSGGTGSTTAAGANANLQTFTTTATASGTTALSNTSTYYQYFTGSLAQTITLPLNTDIKNGWSFHVANNSTSNLTVNSNSGALVATIIPQTTQHITCVDATVNTAAAWDSGSTDFGSLTGTGAAVLATSPTLVTPALGTPSALVGTNITGTASAFNINGTVGATTQTTGQFTSIACTSVTDTSSLGRNAGQTANVSITNQATFTTGGQTLLTQTAAVGSTWRIRAFGQFTAASSATVRTAQVACFWGTTQLVAITPSVLISVAQTTQWQCEFTLTASSTTAIWTAGTLISRIASATALAIDNATAASTTVTAGAQTLDLRFRVSSAIAAESWIIQSVIMERLK